MPELRRDATLGEWVVVAAERAARPHQLARKACGPRRVSGRAACPLCPGHERETPPEVYAVRSEGGRDEPGWTVRVVPNRFPAMQPGGEGAAAAGNPFFRRRAASGFHEVVVETPAHGLDLWELPLEAVEQVVQVWTERYRVLAAARGVAAVALFRNQGPEAGASLAHSHSQIVATGVLPSEVARRHRRVQAHYRRTGRHLYAELAQQERAAGARILFAERFFTVFVPFAARSPLETWFVPGQPGEDFAEMGPAVRRELARLLRTVLARLASRLDRPPYNLVCHTSPVRASGPAWWFFRLVPRLTTRAGFEMGTGMDINPSVPEQAAAFLRA